MFLVWLFLFSIYAVGTQSEDSCRLEDGRLGRCVKIRKCTSIYRLLREKVIFNDDVQFCRSRRRHRKVCCPPKESLRSQNLESSRTRNPGEISRRMCEKYYPRINTIFYPTVFNGSPASPKEFSHMAIIGYQEDNKVAWACGGGLISEVYVLTAAHCLTSRTLGPAKYVRMGTLNILSPENDSQDFRVRRLISHPKYRHPLKYHDIGLIQLDRPVIRNDFVKIACLDTQRFHEEYFMRIAGWGQTEFAGERSGTLLKADVNVVNFKRCTSFYQVDPNILPNGIIDDWMVCAGGTSDTCNGDSGGPLVTRNLKLPGPSSQEAYDIVGVTSFGKVCGIGGAPGIYTRVYSYLQWIEDVVWPNEK